MSIEVSGLTFGYDPAGRVLDGVSVTARDGELLSVLGPNGVGKSTLFRCILGLLTGYSGTIAIGGRDIRRLSVRELASMVAYIPQSHHPSFNYSVFDMVLMGTTAQVSSLSAPGKRQLELTEQALARMGILHLRDRGYSRISGGERQMVLIARALVQNAKVLVLDEPTANLDYGNQLRVMTQIKSLTDSGYTVLQSTHNPEQAFLFSDHVLAIKDGKVLADGSPAQIVTAGLIQTLYGAEIEVQSLYDDRVRVCIPKSVIG